MRLNLGCGGDWRYGEDWINVDSHWSPEAAPEGVNFRQTDMRDLSFIGDGIITEIYSRHAIEHIPWGQAPDMFVEWNRVLVMGGELNLITPDYEAICRQFLAMDTQQRATEGMRLIFGGQAFGGEERDVGGDFHGGGFTTGTLKMHLEQAGFEIIKMEQFDDSCTPALTMRAKKVDGAR